MRAHLMAIAAAILLPSCAAGGGNTDTPDRATTTTTAAVTTTAVQPGASWKRVAPPVVEGSTDAVTVNDGTLVDGRYWASVWRVSGTDDVVFKVARAYFGAACEAWAKERGATETCPDDYAVDDIDSALVAMTNDATATVAQQDGPGTNYSIDGDTLRRLVLGTVTSPVDRYQWVPFPFVVTVKSGLVVAADQFWVP